MNLTPGQMQAGAKLANLVGDKISGWWQEGKEAKKLGMSRQQYRDYQESIRREKAARNFKVFIITLFILIVIVVIINYLGN